MSTSTPTAPNGVQAGLSSYGLGDKLRQLRHSHGLRLIEIAASSGLSPSLISKLESNKLFPTLPTLWRLAEAFHVSLDYFFTNDAGPSSAVVTRAADRQVPASTNGRGFLDVALLDAAGSNAQFHVSMTEIAPSASVVGQHAGSEFVYVTEGELDLQVEQASYHLNQGDSLYFPSSAQHTYQNPGGRNCRLFLVASHKPQEGL